MFALCHRTVCIYIYILSYQLSQILINTTDLLTMDWQLPDIGKTITNNILPSSLSAYAVRILCRLAVVGYFRAFPYRVALFPWIRIGLYSRKK